MNNKDQQLISEFYESVYNILDNELSLNPKTDVEHLKDQTIKYLKLKIKLDRKEKEKFGYGK